MNSFCDARITLVPKPRILETNRQTNKTVLVNVSDELLNKAVKLNERGHHRESSITIVGMQGWFNTGNLQYGMLLSKVMGKNPHAPL